MSGDDLNLVAVIMAGGEGTRFWPLSTDERPKQFLRIIDNRSLLQKSRDRISGLIPDEKIFVLTNNRYTDSVLEQLPGIPRDNVIGEPIRRDTAAAICLGALIAQKHYRNPVMVILPADHLVEPIDVFQKTILSSARKAHETGALYTFGIKPDYPATGYGYLELGRKCADDDGIEHFHLLSFKEKPDLKAAKRYTMLEGFRWNSGIFLWTADAILGEIRKYIPSHFEIISEAMKFYRTPRWPRTLERAFECLNSISIDYAVMEKSEDVRCVDCTFSWSDMGGWNAMKNYLPRDEADNCICGRVKGMDSKENLVYCENRDEEIMLIGVRDLIIVRSGSKTLVAHKNRTEDIKNLLKERDR